MKKKPTKPVKPAKSKKKEPIKLAAGPRDKYTGTATTGTRG